MGQRGWDVGEHRSAPAPLDQLDTEHFFQLAHLHRKRGLTDSALLRGSSEVLVTSKCIKIMKLPDRNHADKLSLTWRQSNFIGFFAPNGTELLCRNWGTHGDAAPCGRFLNRAKVTV